MAEMTISFNSIPFSFWINCFLFFVFYGFPNELGYLELGKFQLKTQIRLQK